jgi:hypothetical protein
MLKGLECETRPRSGNRFIRIQRAQFMNARQLIYPTRVYFVS